MAKIYELGSPHPVRLERVDFVDTQFSRTNFGNYEDLDIPELDISVLDPHIVLEELYATLIINVKTKNTRSKKEKPAFKMSLNVFVFYRCAEFEHSDKALSQFMNSDASVLIVWPYIRSYVNDIVARSGLPDFHIPLAQIRTSIVDRE